MWCWQGPEGVEFLFLQGLAAGWGREERRRRRRRETDGGGKIHKSNSLRGREGRQKRQIKQENALLIKSVHIYSARSPQMNFISRWIKNNALYEMNWNGFNYVSAKKRAECKDLYIYLNEQSCWSPCKALKIISAHLNLSVKLNIFLNKTPTFRLYYIYVKTQFEY